MKVISQPQFKAGQPLGVPACIFGRRVGFFVLCGPGGVCRMRQKSLKKAPWWPFCAVGLNGPTTELLGPSKHFLPAAPSSPPLPRSTASCPSLNLAYFSPLRSDASRLRSDMQRPQRERVPSLVDKAKPAPAPVDGRDPTQLVGPNVPTILVMPTIADAIGQR